jgi:hypothetical protein
LLSDQSHCLACEDTERGSLPHQKCHPTLVGHKRREQRKYAIRLLHGSVPAPRCGAAVREALTVAWSAANGICAKRLVPFLRELIPARERHGHLHLDDEVRTLLLVLSPATADRLPRPARQAARPRKGLSTDEIGHPPSGTPPVTGCTHP